MGAHLVGLVLQRWKHLNDTAFRILIRMALTALDQEKNGRPPNLYFRGHELLAMSLRRPFPEGSSEQARKARQNVLRDVRRSVKELVKEGAIEVVDTGEVIRQGQTQTYRLTLWSGAGVVNPSSAGAEDPSSMDHTPGAQNPSSGGVDDPCAGGVLSPHEEGVTTPPRKEGGTTEERKEENVVAAGDQPQDSRMREREPLRTVPTDGVRDPWPAVAGVPGQRAMLLAVSAPARDVAEYLEDQDDDALPYGRCEGCHRAFLRSRPACPHCGLMQGDAS